LSHPRGGLLAVFDLAGTTVAATDEVAGALRDAFFNAGFNLSAVAIQAVRGRHKRDAIATLLDTVDPSVNANRALADQLYMAFRGILLERYTQRPVTPIPGAAEAIRWLRSRGVRTALTTGFDRPMLDLVLEQVRWERSFVRTIVCADDVARGRPAPDMIQYAMRSEGVDDSSGVTVIGDTPADLQAARAAGAGYAVAVLSGAATQDMLAAEGPATILRSVAELPAWWDATVETSSNE